MTYLAPFIFALAEYITGRDFFSKLHLPGRSIWYVAPVLMLVCWPFSHALAWLALGWALWRSVLGWSSFGSRMDIKTRKDVDAMLLRNLISVIPTIIISIFIGVINPVALWFTFAALAIVPNVWYGYMTGKGKDVAVWVDIAHGILFGLGVILLFHG